MTTLVVVLLLLAGVALGSRQLPTLREVRVTGRARTSATTVSVIVPARNEALSLPTLLASLSDRIGDPGVEVIVVDDSSTDDTVAVAREHGAHVVSAPAPPPGWTGKAWACHVGAEASTGAVLAFVDADVALAPGAWDAVMELSDRHGGLVSVQPHHRAVRVHEQFSCFFNLVSLMGSGAFAARPRRVPMAFGPCLVMTRDDYVSVGGHRTVRAAILDDAELAAAFHRAGLPVTCAIGGSALSMRMYPQGWRQLVEGWSKNMASGAGQADRSASTAAGLWVASQFAVAVGALSAGIGAVVGRTVPGSVGAALLWAIAYAVSALLLRHWFRRVGDFRWWTWAAFPLPLFVFGAVFARSMVLTHVRGRVSWSGRSVPLSTESAGDLGAARGDEG